MKQPAPPRRRAPLWRATLALHAVLAGACSLTKLPEEPPALSDMQEPLDLRHEPEDEAARAAMPAGTFSGLTMADARDTIAARLGEPGSLTIAAVVENSPADQAGLRVGDLVLEVQVGREQPRELRRPSEWRQLELASEPGAKVVLLVDRAGREARAELTLVPRAHPAVRQPGETYREENRVGVVFRTATEVEARSAGLGPGGGVVLIGMSAKSPWRAAGLQYRDLIVAVDDLPLLHPQDLLATLLDSTRERVRLTFDRDGARHQVTAQLSARAHEMSEVSIPLLFSYEAGRGKSEWSLLMGLLGYESTKAAWRFTLLWLIGFGGGDADTLLETDS
ncbi:MAG: PDZ domain-containing protein [Planctomycetes bacterium]|nr:PDZ domain-containing protein [Planctomycetota bacterium]